MMRQVPLLLPSSIFLFLSFFPVDVVVTFAPTVPFTPISTSSSTLHATINKNKNKNNNIQNIIPNPFKALPWNQRKEQERETRKLKMESARLHRELGIADDATFEEIMDVTGTLIQNAELEKDVKKKIRVEVAKDRIMQIKLNERLAGLTVLTEDAKAQSRLEEADEDDEELYPDTATTSSSSPSLSMPGFLQGIIKKPDEKWRNKQLKVFGILTGTCWVLPPMAEKVIMINWLFAAGQVGRRGMTTSGGGEGGGDFNPYEGRRNKPHQRTAILLSS